MKLMTRQRLSILHQLLMHFSTLVKPKESTSTVLNLHPQPLSKPAEQLKVSGQGQQDRFACEIIVSFAGQAPVGEQFEFYGIRLVSTIPDLSAKCDEKADIIDPYIAEDPFFNQCADGIYMAFVQGNLWREHNINPEFGTDDGDWVFDADDGYPRYIPLSVADKKEEKGKEEHLSLKDYLANMRTGSTDGNE